MYRFRLTLVALLALAALASAQTVPQGIYYKFNEGAGTVTLNEASPGVGNPVGTIVGSLGWGAGQFGGGLTGTGQAGSANYVDTGYAMNLNGMSWTIEFWWAPAPSGSLQYLCGSNTSSSSFRIFASSTAGNNVVLSGSGTTTAILSGAVPAPGVFIHVAYVFDAAVVPPTLTGYVNGVQSIVQPQTGAPVLNTGNLVVGAQSTQAGLNGTLDEFRLWLSARTGAEVLATYNTELFNSNILSATTTGGGVGDLNLSLSLIDPSATEGYTLISATPAGPVGMGPFFGLYPDTLTWFVIQTPIGAGNPLHFITGIFGVYPDAPFVAPPGSLSAFAGTSFDFSVVLLGSGFTYVGKSNTVRVTW